MYRAGPARGPNPIRMKGSNLSSHPLPPTPSLLGPSLLDSELGSRNREGKGPPRAEGRRTWERPNPRGGKNLGDRNEPLAPPWGAPRRSRLRPPRPPPPVTPRPRIPPHLPPYFLVSWSGRELRGARTCLDFGLRDSIRDLLPREDQISRRRRAELHFSGSTLWCLVAWCNRGVGLEGRAWGSID
jgi:hypothetical protein